jgi:hypothetical protein
LSPETRIADLKRLIKENVVVSCWLLTSLHTTRLEIVCTQSVPFQQVYEIVRYYNLVHASFVGIFLSSARNKIFSTRRRYAMPEDHS